MGLKKSLRPITDQAHKPLYDNGAHSYIFRFILVYFQKQYTVEGHTEAAKLSKNEGSRE